MIDTIIIDKIIDLPIADVIEKSGVSLKRAGKNWQACCPFHDEKTPSFSVSPAKNIFKCFGCGAGGNTIAYVMRKENLDFIQAVKKLGADHNITIPETPQTDEQAAEYKQAETLKVAAGLCAEWYEQNLAQSAKAKEYAEKRFGDDIIKLFDIGFAPAEWQALGDYANGKISEETLQKIGVRGKSDNGKEYDFFRNRLIFPIHTRTGRVVGFSGRDLSGEKGAAKYINSPDTQIFHKGKLLYGFHLAYTSIKQIRNAILVEGNADVLTMHKYGCTNTIGTCGTALTADQINLLKPICDSITIIGDGDKAGQIAMRRNAEIIIEAGIACNVVPLPEYIESEKQKIKCDPDSFFTSANQAKKEIENKIQDFIIYLVSDLENAALIGNDITQKSRVMQHVCELISKLSESLHTHYLEQIAEHVRPKSLWEKTLKEIIAKQIKSEKTTEIKIPAGVSQEHLEKYGFYETNNCYKFQTKSGAAIGSNFVMRPLFHIEGENSRRIFHVINEHGHERRVELKQEELINLSKLRLRMESLGNFIFNGSEVELIRLKRYLYEQTQTCKAIDRLGWHKSGFWAWANGIFNDNIFTKINDLGIVETNEESYYLPYFSEMHKSESAVFVTERKFRHTNNPNPISLHDYAEKLIDVFGENARVGLCFYFATLFRDIIVKRTNFFPILNLFGQKGAGKTELARSLLRFFFADKPDSPNYVTATKAGLADHVATYVNTLCHIDEYKNNIADVEKVEFLKGLWDGTGRTRINMDRDKKKETTAVDVGVMLTGQEMPTADIALFNRLIFLTFSQTSYTDEEKTRFSALKEIEARGLTHITLELIQHRKHVEKTYFDTYEEVSADLQKSLQDRQIEDRTFKNWLIPLAALKTLEKHIKLPFTYEQCIEQFTAGIIRQNTETVTNNDVAGFWRMVEFLAKNGDIQDGFDFRIETVMMLKTDKTDAEFPKPVKILLIDHTRIFQLYLTESKRAGEKTIPTRSLEYYLKTTPQYLGKKGSVAFKYRNPVTRTEEKDYTTEKINRKYNITTSFVFMYEELNIAIETSTGTEDEFYDINKEEKEEADRQANLIF